MTTRSSANLTIMFTDIVGFTKLTANLSRAEIDRLMRTHDNLLLPIVRGYRGKSIKSMGDGLLNVFTSPTDALLCAMAIHDTLFAHNALNEGGYQIHLRIALHVGEVHLTENDVIGDPVNVASRIESLTPADNIYFSEAVYMTMNRAEVPSEDLGPCALKGVPRPIRVYRIPPYSSLKLMAESQAPIVSQGHKSFPFGGAHLLEMPYVGGNRNYQRIAVPFLGLVMIMLFIAAPVVFTRMKNSGERAPAVKPQTLAIQPVTPVNVQSTPTTPPPPIEAPPARPDERSAPLMRRPVGGNLPFERPSKESVSPDERRKIEASRFNENRPFPGGRFQRPFPKNHR